MKSIPGELKDMLKVFAPGTYGQLRELVLPHLKPFFAASLKLGLVLGIKASVIGEYFGANNGIGFQIQASFQSLQVRRLFSWGIILVLLIVLLNQLFSKAKRAGESIRQISRRHSELKCSVEDVEVLKSLFLGNFSAGRICLQNVSFSYTKAEELLSGIDLTVSEKQVAVISGESGLGKSTLIKITASLLKPGSGRVIRPVNLGVVFQDDRFLPWRDLCWNIALPLIYRGYNRKQALCFARYLLQEVGLDGNESLAPHELSGGMKKRLAFARCFASIPEAILLDEPFTGLHLEARLFLWRKFFELLHLHPVPVVIVTHFPEEIPEKQRCSFYTLSGKPAGLLTA